MTTLEKVKKARKRLQDIETQKAELEGRRKQLMERLKSEFGFDTIEEADKAATKMEKDLKGKNTELFKLLQELDERMEGLG